MTDTAKQMEQTKLLHIPLKDIRENPVALRPVDKSGDKYLLMVDSVKQEGILNPINVREISTPGPEGQQLYSVCDGLHRYTAACDAGLTTIPAQVVSKTDAEVLEAQIIANIHKVETQPAQYSKQLNRMVLQNPDLTLLEISTRLAQSTQWLSDRLSLVNLQEDIQKDVDAGLIKVSNAVALAKLPPEMQADFIDRAKTQSPGEFVPSVAAAVKAHRDAIRAGRDPSDPVFVAVPMLQKLGDVKAALENIKPLADELIALAAPKTPVEVFELAVKWCLRSDPKSISIAKQKWEADQKAKEDKKAAAKAEREAKKLQAANAPATTPATTVAGAPVTAAA